MTEIFLYRIVVGNTVGTQETVDVAVQDFQTFLQGVQGDAVTDIAVECRKRSVSRPAGLELRDIE